MSAIRVLVIEDSLTVRKRLVEVLAADAAFEVVGEGEDGKAAIELCQRLRPDVLTLDMMLPVMNGLTATEYIMAYCPTPILIVSASINRSEALRTMDALAAGAVDVLDKPSDDVPDAAWEQQFKSAVRMAARVKVIMHPRARLGRSTAPRAEPSLGALPPPNRPYDLVAIGASTGGPAALVQILPALPAEFALPIVLAVHLDRRFDLSFLEWLNGACAIPAMHAVDNMPLPQPGTRTIVLAPSDRHLVIEHRRLRLRAGPERNSCRPSIDTLFESIAAELGGRAICCLLTGMGQDGAAGLLAARKAGSLTIAQDQATSIIFGMPGEAIRRGAAISVLPLDRIAPALAELSGRRVPEVSR